MAEKNQDKTNTKQFVEVEDIRDKAIVLKDGSLRGILEVGSINFELKSTEEQEAIIQYFQNFLNSLDFSLQISVISRRLNIDSYVQILEEKRAVEQNELMKIQIGDYKRFVTGLTELANIMSKKFYVVIPYHVQELGIQKQGLMDSVKSMFSPSKTVQKLSEEKFGEYQRQLIQRIEVVLGGLGALGLKPRILEAEELKDIFFNLYNPEEKEVGKQNGESGSKPKSE